MYTYKYVHAHTHDEIMQIIMQMNKLQERTQLHVYIMIRCTDMEFRLPSPLTILYLIGVYVRHLDTKKPTIHDAYCSTRSNVTCYAALIWKLNLFRLFYSILCRNKHACICMRL